MQIEVLQSPSEDKPGIFSLDESQIIAFSLEDLISTVSYLEKNSNYCSNSGLISIEGSFLVCLPVIEGPSREEPYNEALKMFEKAIAK